MSSAIQRVLALCDEWDKLSKGESTTTRQIRDAIRLGHEDDEAEIARLLERPRQWTVIPTDLTQPTLFGEPCD